MFKSSAYQNVFCLIFLSTLIFSLTGCGVSRRTVSPASSSDTSPQQVSSTKTNSRPKAPKEADFEQMPEPAPTAMDLSSSLEEITSIEKQLELVAQEWKGTPYRFGGEDESGIDCSAFTQTVFHDLFDKDLPRNTREQLQVGAGIRRKSIQTGDLVFFKTGRRMLHVGISMGDGDFLHASSSGVMISNMGEPYWAMRYLGARRVL